MSTPYLCIGGPIDGQYRQMAEGCDHMRVPELPPAQTVLYSRAEVPVKDLTMKVHNYYLATHRHHGLAWFHEDCAHPDKARGAS